MAERLSPEQLSWAHECAAAGDSLAEIGSALALDAEALRRQLKLRREMTEEEAEVASLMAAGVGGRIIGQMLGRSSAFAWTVKTRLSKLGFRMPEPAGKPPHDQRRSCASAYPGHRGSAATDAITAAIAADLPTAAIRKRLKVTRSQVAGVRYRLKHQSGSAHV